MTNKQELVDAHKKELDMIDSNLYKLLERRKELSVILLTLDAIKETVKEEEKKPE